MPATGGGAQERGTDWSLYEPLSRRCSSHSIRTSSGDPHRRSGPHDRTTRVPFESQDKSNGTDQGSFGTSSRGQGREQLGVMRSAIDRGGARVRAIWIFAATQTSQPFRRAASPVSGEVQARPNTNPKVKRAETERERVAAVSCTCTLPEPPERHRRSRKRRSFWATKCGWFRRRR